MSRNIATEPLDERAAPTPATGLAADALPAQQAPSDAARVTYTPDTRRRGVALCLSGGGYRAALFHLGAVRRLNELRVLGSVDTITSVSGGSILAAHLAATMGPAWPGPEQAFADFEATVAQPFHAFCNRNIRTGPLIAGLAPWNLFRGSAAVAALERQYFALLTQMLLTDLPARPRFVFCSTDMAYGVNWTFTRDEVGSYQAGFAPTPPDWHVARAVAASSCFPPFFNPQPVGLRPEALRDGRDPESKERNDRVAALRLSDGGLYDNMGLEPVWKNHAVVLVSEGGSTFDAGADGGLLWRLNRYIDIQGRQGGSIRKRWLISSFVNGVLRGTYWGIGTEIENYEIGAKGYSPGLVKRLIAEVRTDMDRFEEPERMVLENHGYLLADAAARRYVPFLVMDGAPPPDPPHPDYMDPAVAEAAVQESSKRRLPFGRGWPT
jgi:NTE family protein